MANTLSNLLTPADIARNRKKNEEEANKEANLDSYRTPSANMDYGYKPSSNTSAAMNDPANMDYSFDSAGVANRGVAEVSEPGAWDSTKEFMASDGGEMVMKGGANILTGLLARRDVDPTGGSAGSGAAATLQGYLQGATGVDLRTQLNQSRSSNHFGRR
jgi:hypothetical protein